MDTRDELDDIITSSVTGTSFNAHPGRCPDDATLSLYVDRLLTGAEARAVDEHLGRCRDCLELIISARASAAEAPEAAPAELVDKGMKLVQTKKSQILEIVARLARDAVELVSCNGSLLASPSPSFARSGPATTGGILRVSREFEGLEVVVEVERLGSGAAELGISAVLTGRGQPGALRASLIDGARELCSLVMDQGHATFEQIEPGRYTIRISRQGAALGEIELEIIG